MKNKYNLKKYILELRDIEDKIEYLLNIRYEYPKPTPYINNEDIPKFIKLSKREKELKKLIRKEVWFWKYIYFLCFDVRFYKKFLDNIE